MWEKFNLTMLPSHGKLFVGIFTALVLVVMIWAGGLAIIESGIFGSDENEMEAQAAYDYQADMDAIKTDSQAVTAPDWTDSGQEEPITNEDLGKFAGSSEQTTWEKFVDNLKLGHVHLNGHTALFFAIGVLFFFSTASIKMKKIVYWVFGPAILIHAIGLAGTDTCPYAKILIYIGGPLILLSVFYMSIKIFSDLRKKPSV
jgi:hypothetical protein